MPLEERKSKKEPVKYNLNRKQEIILYLSLTWEELNLDDR